MRSRPQLQRMGSSLESSEHPEALAQQAPGPGGLRGCLGRSGPRSDSLPLSSESQHLSADHASDTPVTVKHQLISMGLPRWY